jgi:hypothetical protein
MASCGARSKLVSEKDKTIVELIKEILDETDEEQKNNAQPADVAEQDRLDTTLKKLSDVNPVLSMRHEPLVKHMISQQNDVQLKNLYGVIKATAPDETESSLKYKKAFDTFLNSVDCVSIVAGDPQLIGKLEIRDAFLLSYFSQLTVRRTESDNLLQLIICGKSSCGECCCKNAKMFVRIICCAAAAGAKFFLRIIFLSFFFGCREIDNF